MPFRKGEKPPRGKKKSKLWVKGAGDKNAKRKAERAAAAWPKSVFQAGAGLELYPYLGYVNRAGDHIIPMAKKPKYAEPPAMRPRKDVPDPDALDAFEDFNPVSDEAKRAAIAACYWYDFDAPPRGEWAGKDGTILSICRALPSSEGGWCPPPL